MKIFFWKKKKKSIVRPKPIVLDVPYANVREILVLYKAYYDAAGDRTLARFDLWFAIEKILPQTGDRWKYA